MDKIKVSDIRAKFPMYSDLPDEDLVLAIRRKYYADIPIQQFVQRIEFQAPDPTEGMSGMDKFLAGTGKAFADIGRGVGQMVGAVSRDDVAESRRLDAALMNTGAGAAGNVFGNVAAMLPTAIIPGAATLRGSAMIGAVTGAAMPSVDSGETLKNVGLGGVLGPASVLGGRLIGAGARGGAALMEPFTKKGQEAVAARTLQQFAANPQAAAASLRGAKPLVPGSVPTMAQASDDSGLAQLERILRNNPETGPLIQGQLDAQRSARLQAVQGVAGDDAYYNAIKEGRSVFAKQDYDAAISSGFDPVAMAQNASKLTAVLERPSIKSAREVARRLAAENGEDLTDLGSVKGLDYLVKALDDKISAAKNVGSSIGKEELRSLVKTKADLTEVIEQVAPAYKAARDNFAGMSRSINSMDVGRDLLNRMQSPLARAGASTRELKNEYARALEQSMESVKRATGMDLPLSKVVNAKDVDTLQSVAKDMARAAKADDAGRAVGSNTAQNLASQNLLRRTLGPTGLPQTWSESNLLQGLLAPYTGLAKLAGSERAVMDRLGAAAMDPSDAARLLTLTQQPSRVGLLGAEALRYAPVPSLGLLGYSPQ